MIIKICGKDYKVKKTNRLGAFFDGVTQVIEIGDRNFNSDVRLESFIHEVTEAIAMEMACRYKSYVSESNEGTLIMFTHKEHELFCKNLAMALKPYFKKELFKNI